MDLEIVELEEVSESVLAAVNDLISQLSRSAPPLDLAGLALIANNQTCHLLLCLDGMSKKIIGMLTLVVFPIPTGTRAWIEDVVVDSAARGRGAGESLTMYALDLAERHGAKTIELTSRPSREAANRLYRRLGFSARETNVYRKDLSGAAQ